MVAVRVDTENVAALNTDNMSVELAVSGEFGIAKENVQAENKYTFGTEAGEAIYANCIWDNDNNGYTLGPGPQITLVNIKFWLFK